MPLHTWVCTWPAGRDDENRANGFSQQHRHFFYIYRPIGAELRPSSHTCTQRRTAYKTDRGRDLLVPTTPTSYTMSRTEPPQSNVDDGCCRLVIQKQTRLTILVFDDMANAHCKANLTISSR
jgi:hypothetical protein